MLSLLGVWVYVIWTIKTSYCMRKKTAMHRSLTYRTYKTDMAADEMDRSSVYFVFLVAFFAAFTVALVAIQIMFVIRLFQTRCRNSCSFLTVAVVGLAVPIHLTVSLTKGITGCRINLYKSFASLSFLFNNQHLSTEISSDYDGCCSDFRVFSILTSVILLVTLINQTIVTNWSNQIQTAARCVTISYFAVLTGAVIWIYNTSGSNMILTASLGILPTCPQAARAHILPVLMETLFIYGPALIVLLKTLNSHERQLDDKLKCKVFKDCWSGDGGHCTVCFGSNGLLRDACIFHAFIILILRPTMYFCGFNGSISEVFVCGFNSLISVVLSINGIPHLKRIFIKSTHAYIETDL